LAAEFKLEVGLRHSSLPKSWPTTYTLRVLVQVISVNSVELNYSYLRAFYDLLEPYSRRPLGKRSSSIEVSKWNFMHGCATVAHGAFKSRI
jgi:hypothetical protein